MIPVEDGSVVTWEILTGESDDGASLEGETSETENGHTAVKLTAGSGPYSRYKVRGRLTTLKLKEANGTITTLTNPEGFATVKTQSFEVVPGATETIQLAAVATDLPADGKSELQIEALLSDREGNPVARSTDVHWRLEGGGKIINPKFVVGGVDGMATASVV